MKRNSRCTTLERWFGLIQHGGGRESSQADVLPALHCTEACSSCQFTLEILLQKAYKVTQEQAQAYHSLICEKANAPTAAADDDEDHPTADDESDSDALHALYASINMASNGKRVTSGLESDVLHNLETISIARRSVREEIDRELQLIRESEADLERLSDDLQQTLMHSDVAARELNSLTGMVHMLSDAASSTSGGNDSLGDFAGGPSVPSLLFTVRKEDVGNGMGHGLVSLNGMRLAYNPIPRLHLNWAEINVAWTVAASALCCLRHLYKLPLTAAVTRNPSGTTTDGDSDTAGAGAGRGTRDGSGASTVWTVTLRPLRNRTLIRLVQFRVPADEGSHRARQGLGRDRTSSTDDCQYNNEGRCDVMHDETICLAGRQSTPLPPSSAAVTTATTPAPVPVPASGSDNTHRTYQRAVYAFAAYTLATARDVGRYDELPLGLVRLDGQTLFVGDEGADARAAPMTSAASGPASGSASGSASRTGTGLGSKAGSKVGLKVSGEGAAAQSVCPEEELTECIGDALCCLVTQ